MNKKAIGCALAFSLGQGLWANMTQKESVMKTLNELKKELSKQNKSSTRPLFVYGDIIVKMKKSLNKSARLQLENKLTSKFDLKSMNKNLQVYTAKTSLDPLSLLSEIEKINKEDGVAFAEPNYLYYTGQEEVSAPADPRFSELWGLKNTGDNEPRSSRGNSSAQGVAGADIDALKAWAITKGSRSVKIAVIDTGIDYNHPDLDDNMWVNTAELNGEPGVDDDGNGYVDDVYGYDFANNDGDPMDGNGHGTHCAGTIAAEHDNQEGVAGVMAEATLVGVKFLTDSGSGTTEAAIRAVDYATAVGVDIMSNSWGGGGRSEALKEAIERANNKGILFVAAAGNSSSNNDTRATYPANYEVDNVIAVASHTYNDTLSSFSSYGSRTVHVAAPGQNVLSTTPNNSYAVYSGTSMATPHVSGVLGLYLAHTGKSRSVTEVKEELMKTSVNSQAYTRTLIGQGRANAFNLLSGIYPARPEMPDENLWRVEGTVFETEHPYVANTDTTQTVTVEGAKFLRLKLEKFDTEAGYDFIEIYNANGDLVDQISGAGTNYGSYHVDGDTMTIRFRSDYSVNRWGARGEVEVIYED